MKKLLGFLLAMVFVVFAGCQQQHGTTTETIETAGTTTIVTNLEGDKTTMNSVSTTGGVVMTTTTAESATKIDTQKTTTTTTVVSVTPTTNKVSRPIQPSLPAGAKETESALANAYKLLTQGAKKLTIGYLGGSITLGVSAEKDGGSIEDSWVNRTSAWFQEQFPAATIETVNAGVSDTGTNFGLFRLEQCLMNENGHDMPDVVFVEFTNNDWTYGTQSRADLETQIESLFRNIWSYNPYAEIVVVSTNRDVTSTNHAAYKSIANRYNIPVISVGSALKSEMQKRGYTAENGSTGFYYTTDDLHPSHRGYAVYFKEIKRVLEPELIGLTLKSKLLYNYQEHAPGAKYRSKLITNPIIIPATSLSRTGDYVDEQKAVSVSMMGTGKVSKELPITNSRVSIYNEATITASFKGNTLGLLFYMDADIEMTYSVDGGAKKTFTVNANNFGWQRYGHAQVFMLGHDLGKGEHTVVMKFTNYNRVNLGGILVNGD